MLPGSLELVLATPLADSFKALIFLCGSHTGGGSQPARDQHATRAPLWIRVKEMRVLSRRSAPPELSVGGERVRKVRAAA